MALSDFKIPTLEVSSTGGSFFVRGVCADDIAQLLVRHSAEIEGFFAKYSQAGSTKKPKDVVETATSFMTTAPELVSQIIALAADEPESLAIVRRLPIGVQREALEKIAELTFAGEGGVKKFMEAVLVMIRGQNQAQAMLSHFLTGTAGFVGK